MPACVQSGGRAPPVLPQKADLPAAQRVVALTTIDEGGLARSVGPQQAEDFTFIDLKTDLVQSLNPFRKP